MKPSAKKLQPLINQLEDILKEQTQSLKKKQEEIALVHPYYTKSAINLNQYLTFRKHDVRKLQAKLGYLGLSRLARAEGHIHASLIQNHEVLANLNVRY
jgi:pyruvate kinase